LIPSIFMPSSTYCPFTRAVSRSRSETPSTVLLSVDSLNRPRRSSTILLRIALRDRITEPVGITKIPSGRKSRATASASPRFHATTKCLTMFSGACCLLDSFDFSRADAASASCARFNRRGRRGCSGGRRSSWSETGVSRISEMKGSPVPGATLSFASRKTLETPHLLLKRLPRVGARKQTVLSGCTSNVCATDTERV